MIKKFRGASFTEVFLRIKEELGNDVLILKQQELKHSPHPNEKVEVTVSLDDISEIPQDTPPENSGTYNNRGIRSVEWRNIDDERAHKQSGGRIPIKRESPPERNPLSEGLNKLTDYMENTLREVKVLRTEFLSARTEFLEGVRVLRDGTPQEFSEVAIALSRAGLPVQTVQELIAETMLLCPVGTRDSENIRAQMLKVLASRISIAPRPRIRKGRPFIQMFLGPTGTGKSSVIQKLASRAKLTGTSQVAIVTTDCYRMGAWEQMDSFANIADIEFEKISGADEVPDVFESLKDNSVLLVDTAGRRVGNAEQEEEILALYEAIRPDEVHLVLPLNMRNKDLEEAIEKNKIFKINRIVFTKLDESSEHGALLWLPIKFDIPLSYISTGQGTDDIVSAEKEIIAEWILGVNNGT